MTEKDVLNYHSGLEQDSSVHKGDDNCWLINDDQLWPTLITQCLKHNAGFYFTVVNKSHEDKNQQCFSVSLGS